MAARASRLTILGLVAAVCLTACAGPAAPSPRTIGLHLENRLANVVLFSRAYHWVGTPPPPSAYTQILPACGGRLDVSIPAATSEKPSGVSLEIDTSGVFDQQLALANNDLNQVPMNALLKALLFWSQGNMDVETWVTITPDEVLQATQAPAAYGGGPCSPWAETPEPS
jgi:hypothetical protein